jgi:hypothetical protein
MTVPAYDATAAEANGVSLTEPVYGDYWGFDDRRTFMLPDGQQFIVYKVMNEGDRSKYQQATNRDVTLMRQTGNAQMRIDPATDRHALITTCVVDWKMYRLLNGRMEPVPFSKSSSGSTLNQWLNVANPSLVDELEKEIRKANPFLMGEQTVEEIDKEIANLQELREAAVKKEQGEALSVGK